jgi:hypothetical protein
MKEIWKDIEGYEGVYQISNFGNARSKKALLKAGTLKTGYQIFTLSKNNKKKSFYVHRLVASAFFEKQINNSTVDHLDGIKSNNAITNLEWVSRKENLQRMFKRNDFNKGENHYNSKLTKKDVFHIRDEIDRANSKRIRGSVRKAYLDLSNGYMVSVGTIKDVAYKMKSWKHLNKDAR